MTLTVENLLVEALGRQTANQVFIKAQTIELPEARHKFLVDTLAYVQMPTKPVEVPTEELLSMLPQD